MDLDVADITFEAHGGPDVGDDRGHQYRRRLPPRGLRDLAPHVPAGLRNLDEDRDGRRRRLAASG
ncbi:MAG: hypothetical protein R3B99_04890 [Polyangiales bacterium]